MMRTHTLWMLVATLLICLPACGDDDGDGDSEPANESTEDEITGPEDCSEEEWFQESDTTCQACADIALGCDSLDFEASEFAARRDTQQDHDVFTVELAAGLPPVASATLKGQELEESCSGQAGSDEMYCETFETSFEGDGVIDEDTITFEIVRTSEFSRGFTAETLVLTDICGQEHTIAVDGSWERIKDENEQPFACEEAG